MNGDSHSPALVSGSCSSNRARRKSTFVTSSKQRAQRLYREAHVFYFALKHPRMPWYARLVAACSVGYVFSPVQLIPNFIPVIGFSDDLLVLFLGVKLLHRITPPEVLTECRELAEAAERQGGEKKSESTTVLVASVIVATLWLLAAVGAGSLMMAYVLFSM